MFASISGNGAASIQVNGSCGSCDLLLLFSKHAKGMLVCTEIGSGRIKCLI